MITVAVKKSLLVSIVLGITTMQRESFQYRQLVIMACRVSVVGGNW